MAQIPLSNFLPLYTIAQQVPGSIPRTDIPGDDMGTGSVPISKARGASPPILMRTSESKGHQQLYDSSAPLSPDLAIGFCHAGVPTSGSGARVGGGTAAGHTELTVSHSYIHAQGDTDVVFAA